MTDLTDLRERERALLSEYDATRDAAPNPRDFRTWNEFYEAQAAHELKLAGLETRLAAIRQEAWS